MGSAAPRAAAHLDCQAGAEAHRQHHGRTAVLRGGFFHEVFELREKQVNREAAAWIVEIINAALLQQAVAQKINRFRGIGDEAAHHDGRLGAAAGLDQHRGALVKPGATGGQHAVLALADRADMGHRLRRAQFAAGGAEPEPEGRGGFAADLRQQGEHGG
jgi:hypothetical protein